VTLKSMAPTTPDAFVLPAVKVRLDDLLKVKL
jgi:hypothetical protein